MKTIKYFLPITFFLIGFFFKSEAQTIILKQTHEQTGVYKAGEKIRVTAYLQNKSSDSVVVKIWENFSKSSSIKKLPYSGDTLVIFNDRISSPGTVIIVVSTALDSATIGAIVDPEKYVPGTKRPKDFDEYWRHEKQTLRKLPIVVKEDKVPAIESGYVCFNTEINCTGPKPARGYFAKPASAKPKSLPIVLYVHAAGVITGSWVRAEPGNAMRYAKMGNGALSFDLNAHGMLNGQPEAYYDSLQNNVLKDYPFIGLGSKKDFYFRGMYLRLIRTLDFLTSQPEWDGKRILVIGESQGGGQALAAAGFDSRVTAAVAIVPAMCDWGGTLAGRKGGWPDPFSRTEFSQKELLASLSYFDVAHIIKGSKAKLVVEIGLIDETCPASAVFAAINQAVGYKTIFTVPYRAHHFSQTSYRSLWEKTVEGPRNAFIEDYLK